MAHKWDPNSCFAMLPAPILHEIFKIGVVPLLDWRWSTLESMKAAAIEVNDVGILAQRGSGGSNPAILTTDPFTSQRPNYRVKVVHLGEWVGIGLASRAVTLNNGPTLGTQSRIPNSGYFYQSTGINQIQANGVSPINAQRIQEGDIIDVYVNFSLQSVWYSNNGSVIGVLAFPPHWKELRLEEGEIYPCVDMSLSTSVLLIPCPAISEAPPRY